MGEISSAARARVRGQASGIGQCQITRPPV